MPPSPARLLRRLPAYAVNGIGVTLGIGVIQLMFAWLAGPLAAQLASSGAVCASLADLPNTAARTRQQVLLAGMLSVAAALGVSLCRRWPLALGAVIALVAFVALMTMSWGVRAAPVSFAPLLAMVFAMAVPAGSASAAASLQWNALGSLAYLAWSMAAATLLRRRYGRLALVATLRATAQLLRSRAGLLLAPRSDGDDTRPMSTWIGDEAALAERLQSARDLLFAAPDDARSRRETAILLRAIELRDVLLASRLDLDLLGDDAVGRAMLERVASALQRLADGIEAVGRALRDVDTEARALMPAVPDLPDPAALFHGLHVADTDPRARLLPMLAARLERLAADVTRMHALVCGGADPLPLSHDELQLFVAPEGWPLRALRAQLSRDSPVLRHALRAALALSASYGLAVALPWASHPHWLVLSVAVVLRGNLEQTLSRRNARVGGTMIGCLLVLLLSAAPAWQPVVFLMAVGVAHSFVTVRYLVTATAATVMALLQAHLVDPSVGFAIGERLADTVLGAMLAWAFSYVLPSWERRSLPRAIARALASLNEYARLALLTDAGAAVPQRLARRRAYDALGALAAAVQRSAFEPERVRLPVRELGEFIDHAQRLMAHLSVIRMVLMRNAEQLEGALLAGALQAAAERFARQLDPRRPADDGVALPEGVGLESLPARPPVHDPTSWLLRRLQVAAHDAQQARRAARASLGRLGNEEVVPLRAA